MCEPLKAPGFNLFSRFIAWPLNRYGRFAFSSTGNAHEFASLVFLERRKIAEIWRDRFLVACDLRRARRRDPVDYQLHLNLAVEGQLLRECLEEVDRLRAARSILIGDFQVRMALFKVA